jgi:uncharacterized protein (TIGR02118 family)
LAAVTSNGTKVIAAVFGDAGARGSELPEIVRSFTGYVPFGEGVTGRDDAVSALVTLHLDGDADVARSLDLAALLEAPAVEAYLVEERRQWNDFTPPVIARVSFVHRKPELTRAEFADHWSNVHTGLARVHHPGVCRYIQNVVIEPLTSGAPDIDGIAELSFRSETDRQERMYDSPEGKQIIGTDVRRFIDIPRGWRILGREIRLRGPSGA